VCTYRSSSETTGPVYGAIQLICSGAESGLYSNTWLKQRDDMLASWLTPHDGYREQYHVVDQTYPCYIELDEWNVNSSHPICCNRNKAMLIKK
jgi:hypothetical protein